MKKINIIFILVLLVLLTSCGSKKETKHTLYFEEAFSVTPYALIYSSDSYYEENSGKIKEEVNDLLTKLDKKFDVMNEESLIYKVNENASIKDVEADALVDIDRLNVIDFFGSFPPAVICTCGLSLIGCVPNIVRTVKLTKESVRYAHLLPENYKIPANHKMRILVLKYKNSDCKHEIIDFYLKHIDFVNNWDLVDLSAPYLLTITLGSIPFPKDLLILRPCESLTRPWIRTSLKGISFM